MLCCKHLQVCWAFRRPVQVPRLGTDCPTDYLWVAHSMHPARWFSRLRMCLVALCTLSSLKVSTPESVRGQGPQQPHVPCTIRPHHATVNPNPHVPSVLLQTNACTTWAASLLAVPTSGSMFPCIDHIHLSYHNHTAVMKLNSQTARGVVASASIQTPHGHC